MLRLFYYVSDVANKKLPMQFVAEGQIKTCLQVLPVATEPQEKISVVLR